MHRKTPCHGLLILVAVFRCIVIYLVGSAIQLLNNCALDPVVQRVDSAIRWINHCPLDNAINFDSTYPRDVDLSSG